MSSSYLRTPTQVLPSLETSAVERQRERERNGRRNPTTRYFAFVALLLDRSFILGNREKYRVELSTEFYLIDLSLSLSLSSAEITRKQRAGDRAEKYVGSNDQISSNAARLLARVYLSDGDRPSENRERMRAHNQPANAIRCV